MNISETYDLSLLELSENKWANCDTLRAYYTSLYSELLEQRRPGNSLEIGSGCGFIKEIDDSIVTSDVSRTRYIDRKLSAYKIHESTEIWDNVIALDVFHHLTCPIKFLESASLALSKRGRIVLCEPAATTLGTIFYRLFHQEPCQPRSIQAPYLFSSDETGEYSNMGIGTAFFQRDTKKRDAVLSELDLRLIATTYRDLIAYPLTGGFSKPSFITAKPLKALMTFEKKLPQRLLRKMGLRMIVVIEKQ